MFEHILIPTDGSHISQEAARAGVRLAKALGARVTGFFAAPAPTPIVYANFIPVGFTSPEEHAKLIEKTAGQYLAFIERTAADAGVTCDLAHRTNDFPAEAIIEAANVYGCDCIFMASHGRSGRRGATLGSETQKVANQSPVPVVIYRVEAAGS